MSIKNILVATDGSNVATKAVQYAGGLAKKLGASITVLGVVDLSYLIIPGVAPAMMRARIVMEAKDILKQATANHVEAAAEKIRKLGVKVMTSIRTGRPAEEIVKEAHKRKVDLVVLGSQGRSAVKAAVLGSVVYGVIHKNSSIPVLVIRK
jgi:nucleotide-binding universal stress UspA family protein